jgi:hypothetical protein
MKAKTFDCVEMMHRGAAKIRKQTGGMTKEEELAFWREHSRNFRQRQKTAQRQTHPAESRNSGPR